MNWLRTLNSRFRSSPKVAAPAAELSEELRQLIARRDTSALQDWLQRLRTDPNTPEVPLLIEEARRADWPAKEVTRLEVFAHFYRGNLAEALRLSSEYTGALTFDGDFFLIAMLCLYNQGRFDDAWQLLSSAGGDESLIAKRADYAVIAALVCQVSNHLDDMKRYIDLARRLAPTDTVAALNAYYMYFELGEMEAFERVRQEFENGQHPIDQAGFALAIVDLAQDNYERGFELLELRYQMTEASRYVNPALFPLRRWQGEPPAGNVLLLSSEQGFGDTVQMARYLPELQQIGFRRLVMEAQPESLTLLQFNFPEIDFVIQKWREVPARAFDCWTGLVSLPHLLKTTTSNVPGQSGYLHVPPENEAYWRARVAELTTGKRLRIGLAWSGFPGHRADRRRSIPFPRMMDAIRDQDVDFFALQTHVPPGFPENLINVSEELVTLSDTAALIAEMDLVIAVDTSVVHLAGAIGKETWLLLPYRYEWRWGLEGEGNHWYDSVKVLRQARRGDWDGLLEDVFGKRLPARASSKGNA